MRQLTNFMKFVKSLWSPILMIEK